jgi:hypothetical protein
MVLLMLLAVSADAQQDDLAQKLIDTEFDFKLGVFYPDKQRKVRVAGGPGSENGEIDVDAEAKLKESEETLSAELEWRFGERWRVAGQYFDVQDSSSTTLSEDIEWEDIVIGAGSSASLSTRFKVFRLFFSRAFVSAPHHNFGIGIGLHWMEIEFAVAGEAIIPGGGSEFRSVAVRVNAPMPDIGAWYTRRLSPKWVFETRLDWLEASIDPYDGSIVNASAGLRYTISKHITAGLNYNYFKLSAGIEDSDWRGETEMRFHGPYVSIGAFW